MTGNRCGNDSSSGRSFTCRQPMRKHLPTNLPDTERWTQDKRETERKKEQRDNPKPARTITRSRSASSAIVPCTCLCVMGAGSHFLASG